MKELKKEIQIEGVTLSEGIGIGKVIFLRKNKEPIPEFAIETSAVSTEIKRYRNAVSSSKKELQNLYTHLEKEGSKDVSGIIETHIQMLDDPNITDAIEEKITFMEQNSESVFMHVIDQYRDRFFKNMNKDRAEECFQDIKDLSSRILRHLNPSEKSNDIKGCEEAIFIAQEIIPTKAAETNKHTTFGFISTIGGYMSHSALICRAKKIPFVSGIDISYLEGVDSDVIIDGNLGIVIVHPEAQTLKRYNDLKKILKSEFEDKEEIIEKDNERLGIKVYGNLDCMEDIYSIGKYAIDTVGLIRTEFLFLQEAVTTLSLAFQFERYKEMVLFAKKTTLTFRLFDIGSDKKIISTSEIEPNPALGLRSLRFLMKYPEIFSLQVKALFLASTSGSLRILIPLVTDYEELVSALSFIENCRKEAEIIHGSPIKRVPIGCMVEVPSFAILASHFAKICDFFSIGTNDLLQYTLAMDRICPHNESSFRIYHPSILQLIKITVAAADSEGIEVSICGEEASNPKYTKLLVGLGIKNFSVSCTLISAIRTKVNSICEMEAKTLADKAASLASADQVLECIEQYS